MKKCVPSISIFFCLLPILLIFVSCEKKKLKISSGSFEEAFILAKNEKKKVFVIISDSKCKKCDHFVDRINKNPETVAILSNEYITYKADVQDSSQKVLAKILNCRSYPFPFFFDSDANLEAFGFPNNPEFVVDDLTKIEVSQTTFEELFKLDLQIAKYKQLISATLQSYLQFQQSNGDKHKLQQAATMLQQSLNIAQYPFNTFFSDTLKHLKGTSFTVNKSNSLANTNTPYLFDSLVRHIGRIKKDHDYNFEFRFKNASVNNLIVSSASHPCTCISLSWPDTSIKQNESGVIKGTFHPFENGVFSKEIYVHTESPRTPMVVLKLEGEVY